MAKLKRDDELFDLLQPILKEYSPVKGDKSNDTLIKKLVRYPDLEEKAFYAGTYPDIMFSDSRNPDKALRSYLFNLKEKAANRDIANIYEALDKNPKLRSKIVDIVKESTGPDIDPGMITVEDVFDESLLHDRTDKWVNGKDGKEYLRQISSEVRRNELLRQLSDLPYKDLPEQIAVLRERYEQISGNSYEIPATTYKREFVTLRQKLGIAIAKKGDRFDDIKNLDPSYDYRRIADKVGTLKNGNLSKEQEEFLERQIRYLESDVSVLGDYEKLASQIGVDIKLPKNLSVKDKISEYRKRLGERLQEISGNADISKKSLAYLDLVESQRQQNPDLYKRTVEELSKEEGIGARRAERWEEKHVPLTTWQELGKTIEAERTERRQELFSDATTTERFQELWKDTKYRSSVSWSQKLDSNGELVLRSDGKPLMVPDGISFVDKQPFRTVLDSDKLKDALQKRIEKLKTKTREELLQDEWESFDSKIRSNNPKYRSSWGWEETKRSDDTVSRHLKGVVRFNGKFYREDRDKDQLESDYGAAVKDSVSKIEEAKKRILDIKKQKVANLEQEISDRKQDDRDTTKLEDRLKKQQDSIDAFDQKDYSYSNIKSYDLRAGVVKSAADFLSAKADILELDPFFDVNKALQGVKPEDRVKTLKKAKSDLASTVGSVKKAKKQLESKGLFAPDWVSKQSLEKQLSWYQEAITSISNMESQSYDDFSAAIADIDLGQLQRQLPKGYLRKVRGKVYRSTVDADKINVFSDRESRILTGPDRAAQSSGQQNSFGDLLQQKRSKQVLFDKAVAAAQSSDFSAAYSALSSDEKKVYDRNYGKPVKEGNTFYRSIYDMPDDVWARAEKAAGYDTPRQRGVPVVSSDINIAEEQSLQQKITEDLKNRTWDPPEKKARPDIKPDNVQEPKVENTVSSPDIKLQEESKNNLKKMLQGTERVVRKNSIGSMGLMGAYVLFNAAMTGPSREAQEHRRQVEEERRIKKYGYNWQQ